MVEELRKTVGSGITTRVKRQRRISSDDPAAVDELSRWANEFNESLVTPWGGQAHLIAAARRGYEAIRSTAPCPQYDLAGYNLAFKERATAGWYLMTVDVEAKIAEAAVAEGRSWEAVSCAMRIGELLTELRLKNLWEPDALSGRASREGARDGAEAKRRATKPKHDAIREEYDRRVAAGGDEPKVKAWLSREFKLTPRHINRVLKDRN